MCNLEPLISTLHTAHSPGNRDGQCYISEHPREPLILSLHSGSAAVLARVG